MGFEELSVLKTSSIDLKKFKTVAIYIIIL